MDIITGGIVVFLMLVLFGLSVCDRAKRKRNIREVVLTAEEIKMIEDNWDNPIIKCSGYFDEKGVQHITSVQSYGSCTAEELKLRYGIDVGYREIILEDRMDNFR